eukprot:6182775-Pleurochrysis_carterae.AAC.1
MSTTSFDYYFKNSNPTSSSTRIRRSKDALMPMSHEQIPGCGDRVCSCKLKLAIGHRGEEAGL